MIVLLSLHVAEPAASSVKTGVGGGGGVARLQIKLDPGKASAAVVVSLTMDVSVKSAKDSESVERNSLQERDQRSHQTCWRTLTRHFSFPLLVLSSSGR